MKKLFVFLLIAAFALSADVIKLTNGKTYEGKAKVKGDSITILVGENLFQFNKREVAEINGEKIIAAQNPTIRIATSEGDMIAELFEDEVPNTVANMISLAEAGFYRGMQFHRIINGFMAQGGCPFSKRNLEGGAVGTGDPGYKFADEFSPKLKHTERGILSMANSGRNTNGSQFFICFGPTPHLDGKHAVFGKVIKGMEVLDKLEAAGTRSGKPSKDIQFNIEVLTKRDHPYVVKKLSK
ncbi:MAG: peptidylprolyl isomerase [Victivallales bacterium]|nr:peptidylprolyl isomerase [Victivallales bacterium]